jgi:hypothetical protein
MAEKNKSIIESALLDAKRIQEALNANTKEILRSVALEEIDGLVKESLGEGYVEEDADEDEEVADVEITDEPEAGEEGEDETEELDDDSEDSEEGDDLEGDDDISMSAVALGGDDEEVEDLTQASDDDVISVYKKLTGDDTIEVVVDDETGDIKLTVNEPGEFMIKTGAEEAEVENEFDADEVGGDDETEEVDEVMYEIALEEMENIDGIKAPIGDNTGDNLKGGFEADQAYAHAEDEMVMSEGEEIAEVEETMEEGDEPIDEKIQVGKGRTVANTLTDIEGAGGKANNVTAPNVTAVSESVNKYNTLLTEAKELRGKNEEYKQALKQFRTMLAETVVFNSNLTYVTKLFMEHSTTKEEKQEILKRFDNEVSTLKESKRLYKSIASELTSRKPMNESVERKFNNEVSSGMSKQLNESTAYIDKETQRIKDLMSRVEKR